MFTIFTLAVIVFSSLSSAITPHPQAKITESSPPIPLQAPKVMEMQPLPATRLAEISNVAEPQPPAPDPPATYSPPAPTPARAPVYAPQAQSAFPGCGDNFYANYIYMHESGCRTNAIGPNGPCGLGQALPCSKLPCSLYDYVCQNAWFTNYAYATYGSWQAAYNFWLGHSYW